MTCDFCRPPEKPHQFIQACPCCGSLMPLQFIPTTKGHWTKEPPTEPGWYFVTNTFTHNDGSKVWTAPQVAFKSEGSTVFDSDRRWSQPIELPEPPEETP